MRNSVNRSAKHGSAVVLALVLGTVLLMLVAGVMNFSSYRISVSTMEWSNLRALALAEAGVSAALAEMSRNAGFQTHKVGNDANLTWGAEEKRETDLTANGDFSFVPAPSSPDKGVYLGKLGYGEFKVKIGTIDCADNPQTKNIDESKAFLKIEAMGKYKETVKRIKVIVQKRYPGREFLMYDGGILSIVYGVRNGAGKVNVFASGNMYGHKGIEIGAVTRVGNSGSYDGTRQEFRDLSLMSSGDGMIYVYSDTEVTFRQAGSPLPYTFKKNTQFPAQGVGGFPGGKEGKGEMPQTLLNRATPPEIKNEAAQFVKDFRTAQTIELEDPLERYKKNAMSGGKILPASDAKTYKRPSNWNGADQVITINFGNQFSESGEPGVMTDIGNGFLYSDNSIAIYGNPPGDVTICSAKNVYIIGDFNQAGRPNLDNKEKFGLPQKYPGKPTDNDSFDYHPDIKAKLNADPTLPKEQRRHQMAQVYAKERIVYDYRDPTKCFENELIPYLKYKLATELLGGGTPGKTQARTQVLTANSNTDLTGCAPTSKDALATATKNFLKNFPLDPGNVNDTSTVDTVIDDLKNSYDDAGKKIPHQKLDEAVLKIWKAFKESYKTNLDKGGLGVYKLLTDLRGESDSAANPDYLWYPEMTNNGMFISAGELEIDFWRGPDEVKYFDEIGNKEATEIGRDHSGNNGGFIHRVYGSEVKLRTNKDNPFIQSGGYLPGLRRKVYDSMFPTFWTANGGAGEIAGFSVVSWEDFKVSATEYQNF